jgi:hypothetical protein
MVVIDLGAAPLGGPVTCAWWSEDSPGIPQIAMPGDGFGAVLH